MRLGHGGDQVTDPSPRLLLTSVTRESARARLGGVAWIDDVVQETLLTVHRARHTYDPSRPFAPWFYAIAGSRLIDVVRRERRISHRELGGETTVDAPAAPSPADEIDVEKIRAAVAS